jgi:succinyl-diaminopimelate desuccinylase
VDEESGGFAGVAHLAAVGRIAQGRTDFVIIPEPLNVDRIASAIVGCWFEVTAHGRIGHGNAVSGRQRHQWDGPSAQSVRDELMPLLASRRAAVPVVPPGARRTTTSTASAAVSRRRHSDAVRRRPVPRRVRRFLIEEGFERRRRKSWNWWPASAPMRTACDSACAI